MFMLLSEMKQSRDKHEKQGTNDFHWCSDSSPARAAGKILCAADENGSKAHFMAVESCKQQQGGRQGKSLNEKLVNSLLFIGSKHIWFRKHFQGCFSALDDCNVCFGGAYGFSASRYNADKLRYLHFIENVLWVSHNLGKSFLISMESKAQIDI